MKSYIGFVTVLIISVFAACFVAAQEIDYNDKVDDEALRQKETEAQKQQMADPNLSDPYYDKHVKDSWENDKEDKAGKIIDDLKKEYGTDKFNKEVLEKGPKPQEDGNDEPSLYPTPAPDPYYENEIRNSWESQDEKLKEELLKKIKDKVDGQSPKEKKDDSVESKGDDTYYDEEIKDSWQKGKEEIVEDAAKKLMDEGAVETKELREKRLKEEEEARKTAEKKK